MHSVDYAAAIDNLLRRPLVSCHLRQLLTLRDKQENGGLSEADKIYIADCWNRFRSLPAAQASRDAEDAAREIQRAALSRAAADLDRANSTLTALREALRYAIAERDQWHARTSELEAQLAELANRRGGGDRKFDQAKRVFAKIYHPNAAGDRSSLDATVRGEVFKEFWVELERIEADD